MATSNSTDFRMNAQSIMERGLRLAGILGVGQSVDAETDYICKQNFNIAIRYIEQNGVCIWGIERALLFPKWKEALHEVPSNDVYTCMETDYRQTTLKQKALLGASSVLVNDASKINSGDYIGLYTQENGILWYTVDQIAGDSVSLFNPETTTSATLPQDVMSDSIVCVFTKKVGMPLRILDARRRMLSQVTTQVIDIPLMIIGKRDYDRIPNKDMPSMPIQLFHQPLINTTNVWLWPTQSEPNTIVAYTFERRYDDIDLGINDVDFPPEAYNALCNLIASYMGREFRIDDNRQAYLDQLSEATMMKLKEWASGSASVRFGVRY